MHTRERLVSGLRAVGVARGELVMVHSSLRAVGPIEGGADTLIDAFMDVLGPDGTLVVPAHTYNYAGGPGARGYHADLPVGDNIGTFPEVLRHRPGAVRSGHPTHSAAAIGGRAAALVADHERCQAVGVGSPLDRLCQWGGTVMMVGVGLNTCTMIHLAEARLDMPYLSRNGEVWGSEALVEEGGQLRRLQLRQVPGCSAGFVKLTEPARKRGMVAEGMVGSARTMRFSAAAMVALAMEALARDAGALLCDRPGCRACDRSRRVLAESGG